MITGIEPREYQQKIFETCSKKNCLVVLPTGMGKTLIALMLAVARQKEFPGSKVVFSCADKAIGRAAFKILYKTPSRIIRRHAIIHRISKIRKQKKNLANSRHNFFNSAMRRK